MTTNRLREELGATARRRIRLRRLPRLAAAGGRGRSDGRRLLPRRTFDRRALALVLIYALVAGAVVVKLVNVQVLDAADYAARSADQRERFLTLPAERGRIYDRGGEVLAASVAGVSIVADPRSFKPGVDDDGEPLPPAQAIGPALDLLAPILDVGRPWLRARLQGAGAFVWLGRQLPPEVGEEVQALIDEGRLAGVLVRDEPRRAYPGGQIAAQVLGVTDIDGAGLAGMELQHDRLLTGQPGWLDFERSRGGSVIPVGAREAQSAVPGTDVVLTLDRQLQYTAERVATDVVDRYDAAGASIVVLEVGTGEVLAMASAPTADLSDRAGVDPSRLRNRAVTDVFEPGSVQKAITAAAAIEAGVVTPETTMSVADTIEHGGKVFSDSHEHPTEQLTFSQVIEESSNVGTIMVADQLGEERLADWLQRFGYGQPTEIGFPGEAAGLLRPVEEWWQTSLPTIAIGQGVAVTLLQQANAYATIANDGVAVQPRLVRGTVDETGRLVGATAPPGHQVVSPRTAGQVREMLTQVVSGDRGTGEAAAVDGHAVAGKTGTARKPRSDGRGYSGEYVATFTGMAPADDPSVVVAVMVDEPSTIWGGVVAAPAFSEVMAEALRRQQVPPATTGPSLGAAIDDASAAAARAAADARATEAELRARRERRRASRAATP